MNEATLESKLDKVLSQLFVGPLRPKLTHQHVLKIKFGHHEALVDGRKRSKANGILDVLLSVEGRAVAVLELKRTGLKLTEDDETQAWSYARLIDPMPPLYIVTNGTESRFFRTYDRAKLDVSNINEKLLADQISTAAVAAALDCASAIQFLLGRDSEVFRRVFQKFTSKGLDLRTGTVADLTQPISRDFQLPRKATCILHQKLEDNCPVVVLVGPPLSGKTNIASQLCTLSEDNDAAKQFAPLYIDCSETRQGVMQALATATARETGISTTADEFRSWLTSGCVTSDKSRPVIVLDQWPAPSNSDLEKELAELIDMAKPETFSIVLVLDDCQSDALLTDSKRGTPTRLGKLAQRITVSSHLDGDEFETAVDCLHDVNQLRLEQGAEHNILFRYPYTWRLLASQLPKAGLVPSILGTEYLGGARAVINPKGEYSQLLKKYVVAVADQKRSGRTGTVLLGSPGWSTWEAATEVIGDAGITKLIEAGFIRARTGPCDSILLSMQFPPLLSSIAASVLSERLQTGLETSSDESSIDKLLEASQRFPNGALVAAEAILNLESDDLKMRVTESLLNREPVIDTVPPDARIAILREGEEPFEVPAEVVRQSVDDMGRVVGDMLSLLVLSYMASWTGNHSAGRNCFKKIVEKVASFDFPVLSIDHTFSGPNSMPLPLTTHTLPGDVVIVSICNGMIEPITDAIRRMALADPNFFETYLNELTSRKSPSLALLHRMHCASVCISHLATQVAPRAVSWAELLKKRLHETLDGLLGITR